MKIITQDQANKITLEDLRLPSDCLDLSSVEAVAGVIRKVAGFKCPCSSNELSAQTNSLLRGLVGDEVLDAIPDVVESMVAYGDLLELLSEDEYGKRKLLFGGPPAFVRIGSSIILLLGIARDHFSPLSKELEARIEYTNHIRKIHKVSEEDINILRDSGLLELPERYWLRAPKAVSAKEYLLRIETALSEQSVFEGIEQIQILTPAKERGIQFYKKRWKQAKNEEGRFIARRPRRFGNDLWSYLEYNNGRIHRALNLPLEGSEARGCDDAWHIQMALDAIAGNPQVFKVREAVGGQVIFDFFSPMPRWACRRWDATGRAIPPSKSLFSYCFNQENLKAEGYFCENNLWLKRIE